MPIYEFYCAPCHTLYNFFSRSVNETAEPSCPICGEPKLSRQLSLFSAIGSAKEQEGLDDFPIDESKMEQAMTALAGEAGNINEDDPQAAAQLMRKMSDMTGLQFNDSMEQALTRMEAGEDPEQIEKELGDLFNDENPFILPGSKQEKKKHPPKHDETLYDL